MGCLLLPAGRLNMFCAQMCKNCSRVYGCNYKSISGNSFKPNKCIWIYSFDCYLFLKFQLIYIWTLTREEIILRTGEEALYLTYLCVYVCVCVCVCVCAWAGANLEGDTHTSVTQAIYLIQQTGVTSCKKYWF
jgi:hypothetical protein